MLARMPRFAFLSLLPLLAASVPALADDVIDKVLIKGLDKGDDAAMIENIEVSLSLYAAIGKPQGAARMDYLLSQAEAQTRDALEPFGYYTPSITVDTPRDGDRLTVTITVDKGEPVKVRREDIAITGPGGQDRYLLEDIAAFKPRVGERFDHVAYEGSKITITRRLADRGYFDADFTQRRVEVTRAEHAADIFLTWDSGRRYDMGPVTFHQDYFCPGLLDKLVYWDEGSYFHQGKLDRLRESLNKLGYFGSIDIQPDPDKADDWRVPVDVNLTLAKRSVYTAGLSYGSESGLGVRGGLERRYLNARGHKMDTQLDWAQKRKSVSTLYRIPAFRWLDGWYGLGASFYDEQTDYIDLRNVKLRASRSGQLDRNWTVIASLNMLRERWRYYSDGDASHQYATEVYPELTADYVGVDDRLFPRKGASAHAGLRGGLSGIGSDANFAQLFGTLRWFLPVGDSDRLILRGEGGTTLTGDLVGMPPSLRFFAGGDRSIRGYAWREVGPRNADKYALGAKHVVTGTAEYEHYFGGGPWGAAAFVDTGSAFDDSIDLHTGIGFGARWRSPVGPVRVDVAHGLNHPDSKFQLYLNVGAEF